MSEADSPNDQSGSPAPTEPNVESWQTIDFPGAMSVDAIPHSPVEQRLIGGLSAPVSQGVIHYSSAAIDQTTPSFAIAAVTSDDIASRQQLEDENAALRDRLARVELDLVQQQIEWQLESARTQTHAETAEAVSIGASAGAIEQPSTFELTERLGQLSQTLERSHQTAQRQQILVETLTEQLESSQERIAQLERDCALTQQRHNEQVQQVLQAEGACRDLRLRLHRQQQQTLQFKAALEKCLEMPTVYGQSVIPDVAIDESAATPDALAALLKPKNQPVKPWSAPRRAAHEPERDQAELPTPLFKLLNGLPIQGSDSNELQGNPLSTPADPSALLDSDDPEFVTHLMQLIFPTTTEQQIYTTTDALQAEPTFDLSPFLRAENDRADAILPVESSQGELVLPERSTDWTAPLEAIEATAQPQEDTVPSNASAIANASTSALPNDRATDPLWDNLAALIDPPDTVEGAAVASVPEQIHLDNATEPDNASDRIAPPIAAWTWRDRLEKASKTPPSAVPEEAAQSPAKLLALSSRSQPTVSQPTVIALNQTEPIPAPFLTVAPSPIVYPLRSAKKLASLAAVDLPTFPKR